jgi:hypothetical protein
MSENDTAAFVFLCIFGLPIIGWITVRAMQHRERMEMLRRGIMPPPGQFKKTWSVSAPPPQPAHAPPPRQSGDEDAQAMLRKGIVVAAVGVALTIGLGFIGTLVDPPHYTYGPWLLGGLIPLFVGVAQIVIAVLSGAVVGAPPNGGAYTPYRDRDPQAAAPPPQSPFESSYTYRPGASPELQPPQPPDRR